MIEIVKGSTDWDHLKWVIKACSKEESRYHLTHLHSTGRHIFGTDGHRAHIYRMEIPKGIYKFTADKKTIVLIPVDGESPEIKQVFPLHKKHGKITIQGKLERIYTQLVRAVDAEITFDLKYIEELIDQGWGFIRYFDNGSPIWMKSGLRSGLVMPVRM